MILGKRAQGEGPAVKGKADLWSQRHCGPTELSCTWSDSPEEMPLRRSNSIPDVFASTERRLVQLGEEFGGE